MRAYNTRREECISVWSVLVKRLGIFVENRVDFVFYFSCILIYLKVGGNTHLSTIRTNRGYYQFLVKRSREHVTYLSHLYRLVKFNYIVTSSREFDTHIELEGKEPYNTGNNEDRGDGNTHLALTKDVELRIYQHVLGKSRCVGHLAHFPLLIKSFYHNTCKEYRCDERRNKTNHKRGCEPLDRTRTHDKEDSCRDDGGDIGVEDGRESVAITIGDSASHRLTGSKLFLDTLKDKHISIDGHTQCKHKPGNTGEREHGVERSQNTKREEAINNESSVCNKTGD